MSAWGLQRARLANVVTVLLLALAPVSAEAVALNPGDVIVEATGLIRVDPTTGAQTVISQGGDGGIAIDAAGNVIFAAKDSGRLFRVDPQSGAEVVISSGLATPFGVAIDNVRGQILVTGLTEWLGRVDPATGTAFVLSSGGFFSRPYALAVDAHGDYFVVDGGAGLIRVDPITGAQTVVSIGGFFREPFGVAIDVAGNIIVTDHNAFGGAGGGIRVDPLTGGQTAISSGGFFTGGPSGVAIDASGRLVMVNRVVNGVFSVDPVTGAQSLISSHGFLDAAQAVAIVPSAPAPIPEPSTVLLWASGLD